MIGAAGGAVSGGIDGANIATTALSGSIGGGGGELLGYTAGKAFGVNPDSTQNTKDTTREAINAVVGMSSMATGLDAHTASSSSNMALDNNFAVPLLIPLTIEVAPLIVSTVKAGLLLGSVGLVTHGVLKSEKAISELLNKPESQDIDSSSHSDMPHHIINNSDHSMSSHKQLPSQTSFPALPNNGKDSQGVPPLPAVESKPEILTTPSHGGEKITKYINPGVSPKDKEQLTKPLITPIPEGIAKPYMLRENEGHKSTYFPDRMLPRDSGGNPVPDVEAFGKSHTQLGYRDGRRGRYPQAREFDAEGNWVKDIDFTDHGRGHPNPHQHVYKPNKTGGTPTRGAPEDLNGK